jgi:LAO/AO transport system kinase
MSDSESALNVMPAAAEAPPSINPGLRPIRRRPLPDPEQLFESIRSGDRAALSRGITLVESEHPAHREVASRLLAEALQNPPPSVRIGITGVPGVGKSTLIETLGLWLVERGHRLAVLAVDPSSASTHGSILGDKSRMGRLSNHEAAFVRPSPTSGALGGVAHQTREAISLCEAAGYDVIFVETVGVGQSETAVFDLVDCFLLLMLTGAGDELQGIKRGIMERADLIAITKADGDNRTRAEVAAGQVRAALRFVAPPPSGWRPDVLRCSAQTQAGVPELWGAVEKYFEHVRSNGSFDHRRSDQAVHWMRDLVRETLLRRWRSKPGLAELQADLEKSVRAGRITPRSAAERLIEA